MQVKTSIRCIAFDCFGTVFDMAGVSRNEISAYVAHVRRNDFAPFEFPRSWWDLRLHPDSAAGVRMLQDEGFCCVTLSNGSADLLKHVSERGGIAWDRIIDLAQHKVYKPHVDAYRVVEKETAFAPRETLMVTANPTFGDVEGSASIGMPSQVVRHGYPNDIVELAQMLKTSRGVASVREAASDEEWLK